MSEPKEERGRERKIISNLHGGRSYKIKVTDTTTTFQRLLVGQQSYPGNKKQQSMEHRCFGNNSGRGRRRIAVAHKKKKKCQEVGIGSSGRVVRRLDEGMAEC